MVARMVARQREEEEEEKKKNRKDDTTEERSGLFFFDDEKKRCCAAGVAGVVGRSFTSCSHEQARQEKGEFPTRYQVSTWGRTSSSKVQQDLGCWVIW